MDKKNKYSLEEEKRILLIGGSGFIGVNIIIKFIEYKIGKILNIDKKPSPLGIKTEYIDLKMPLYPNIRNFKPQYIIYLANVYDDDISTANYTREINVKSLEKLYQDLIDYTEIKKFIYLSDYKVYFDNIPFTEKSEVKKRGVYLSTKLEAEEISLQYLESYFLPIVILRLSDIYGLYSENQHNFLSRSIQSAVQKKEIYIENNNIYDYLYTSDLVQSLILLLDSPYTGILNIGSGKGYSNIDIVSIINEFIPSAIKTGNFQQQSFINNVTLAKNLLSWNPHTNIKTGIKNTIDYFKTIS
ncbi:NAD(P)-dependent oxidoreductase [Patescibacteria group bacterium]|nr:NAD(P)-dependent oxidoreductase [Patescibacteria group bacterium]